jgi:hypothetical protein
LIFSNATKTLKHKISPNRQIKRLAFGEIWRLRDLVAKFAQVQESK